jgi:primosomal protein N''
MHERRVEAEGRCMGRAIRKGQGISEVDELEKLSIEKSNRVISAIENALAAWDAAEEKPPGLEPRINRLKHMHEALSRWERKMLKSMAKKEDMDGRLERLREFGGICHAYA